MPPVDTPHPWREIDVVGVPVRREGRPRGRDRMCLPCAVEETAEFLIVLVILLALVRARGQAPSLLPSSEVKGVRNLAAEP